MVDLSRVVSVEVEWHWKLCNGKFLSLIDEMMTDPSVQFFT